MTGDPVFWLWLLLALSGILLSALCSGLETGVYMINGVRLTVRSGRGEKRARMLKSEFERPGRMLTTLLVGTNAGNYFGSLGVAGALSMLSLNTALAIAINTFILVPIFFIFAETLPKDLFRTHTDQWTYAFASILRGARVLLTVLGIVPLIVGIAYLVQHLLGGSREDGNSSRKRMMELLQEGVGAGLLSRGQGDLANRAMLLRTFTVETEMIPWRRVGTLPLSADQDARETAMRSRSFSRWPVVERAGRVAGILHALDAAVRPDQPTRKLLRPAVVLEPGTPALEALRVMREARAQLAIVQRSGSKRPIGVVGLKDLVEPLTGELRVW
jgi:CBS domain containing-hemolysin-like protein